ncbi:hypothetical protein C8F04DRAFT_1193888 [Mycena alexandri]|uniref:Zinc finger PHD-type domain-containing protein n=1 Tax=Mycena alexandri TaxID=1745969 RepID=A0AAD6S8U0_9AGAR|nr:hypothetical protein C8F04DRAFT_1193888 [Mycena alexandri]
MAVGERIKIQEPTSDDGGASGTVPLVPAPPGNPAHPPATDPGTRRSTRKRKARDELKELEAALEACICGISAAPGDDADYANVARCKNEGCETKWYHLKCLEQGKVAENWSGQSEAFSVLSAYDIVKKFSPASPDEPAQSLRRVEEQLR